MLKAKAPYCRCLEQISLTTNQNRSKMEHEIEKKNRLVHEQAIAEISEATEQDTVCTVCNPPYTDRFAGHYTNEMFPLKFYPVGTLNMNCHLGMES